MQKRDTDPYGSVSRLAEESQMANFGLLLHKACLNSTPLSGHCAYVVKTWWEMAYLQLDR